MSIQQLEDLNTTDFQDTTVGPLGFSFLSTGGCCLSF